MLKYLYIGFLAAALLPSSAGYARDNREYVTPITLGALTVTNSGLGTVEPRNLDGSQVRQIQRALTEKNFYNGTIDGKWNAQTASGVRQFQRAYGLWADSLITTSTLAQLRVPVEISPATLESITPAGGEMNP